MKRTAFLRKPDPKARLTVPVFKPKPCACCKEKFTPTRLLQAACSIPCAKLSILTYARRPMLNTRPNTLDFLTSNFLSSHSQKKIGARST